MGTNELILTRAQAGIESVRGTSVAATRKVYAKIDPTYDRPLTTFQDTSGTYIARRRAGYGRERISFAAADILTFEDGPWWMLLGIDGGVTSGQTDGGTPAAYTYAFLPDLDSDELASATLEHNETGNPYESDQVMANAFTLRMDSDNDSEPGWMLDVDLMGRTWVPTTFTGALTDRTTEVVKSRGTKVYIDDEADDWGDTQLVGSLISASATVTNNLVYKAFAEDEKGAAAGRVGKGELTIDAQFTFEFDNDDEFALYRSDDPVLRKVRLEREGSVVHDAVTKLFQLDMAGYWSSWSRGDRDGNLTATFALSGYFDIDSNMMFGVTFVNALSTLP